MQQSAAAQVAGTQTRRRPVWAGRKKKKRPPPKVEEINYEPIEVVQLEGVAMLKIVRHCEENAVEEMDGSLLGVVEGPVLRITDCYRRKKQTVDREYDISMLEKLKLLGVDYYNVGWYRCAFYNEFFKERNVTCHYDYQKKIPFSVLIVYDPIGSSHGSLALHAYRLKKEMMQQLDAATDIPLEQVQLSVNEAFEEIPIVLHNHALSHGFLYEIKKRRLIPNDSESLALHGEDDAVDLMGRLSESIERYRREQQDWKSHFRDMRGWITRRDTTVDKQMWQRTRSTLETEDEAKQKLRAGYALQDKPPEKKDRVDSVLATTTMDDIATQMLENTSNDFSRMWISKAIQH